MIQHVSDVRAQGPEVWRLDCPRLRWCDHRTHMLGEWMWEWPQTARPIWSWGYQVDSVDSIGNRNEWTSTIKTIPLLHSWAISLLPRLQKFQGSPLPTPPVILRKLRHMPVLWFFYMLLYLDDFNHVKMAKSVRASNLCSYVELCPLEKQFRMFSGCFDSLRKGPGMTLRFPAQGSGPGSCYFQPGLDLDVLEASTSDDSPSMSAMRIPGTSLVVNQSTCIVCITYHHRDVLR